VKYWEIIADKLSNAGFSLGWLSANARACARSTEFLVQKSAILRKAARISFAPVNSEKQAAQRAEKTAQKSLFELQISCSNQLSYAVVNALKD
jgi:hypothetical protein